MSDSQERDPVELVTGRALRDLERARALEEEAWEEHARMINADRERVLSICRELAVAYDVIDAVVVRRRRSALEMLSKAIGRHTKNCDVKIIAFRMGHSGLGGKIGRIYTLGLDRDGQVYDLEGGQGRTYSKARFVADEFEIDTRSACAVWRNSYYHICGHILDDGNAWKVRGAGEISWPWSILATELENVLVDLGADARAKLEAAEARLEKLRQRDGAAGAIGPPR